MNFITTNIRLPEEEYLELKTEAAKKRKSLAAVIREKITTDKHLLSEVEADRMLKELDELAKQNAKVLKGWNSLEALRGIRNNSK